ncbi:MAG: hypothetical protein J6R52_01755 [Alphaproteobacteria bacterium]|nr:hypothetical protein [Alphaproteobacteria bacterium]
MLSYKLKHLCSRVIASLSAVGLFSIAQTGEANAKDQGLASSGFQYAQPGDTFKFDVATGLTLGADYIETPSGCSMQLTDGSDGNFESFVYTSGTTGASGKAPSCNYTCKAGYVWANTTYTTGIIEGSTGVKDAYLTPGTGCVEDTRANCLISSSHTSTISRAEFVSGATGTSTSGYCVWYCKDGYSVEGGRDTTTGITGATGMTGDVYSSAGCKARLYDVKFDCGASGYYKGVEGMTSGIYSGLYGQTFTIPEDATCTRDGYAFSGWSL